MTAEEPLQLGRLLKSLLKERSLSMRKLAALTGIDTATISRIANSKQEAKPAHLRQFASHLGVPMEILLEAAGFNLKQADQVNLSGIQSSFDTIQKALAFTDLFDQKFTTAHVEQELAKYEKYAQTEEGHRVIFEEFQRKVEQVSGAGPFIDDLKQLYARYCQTDISHSERAVIGSGLLYFILSTDIIPDYVFPIGYLDDAMAVKLVMQRLSETANDERQP